MLDKDDLRRPSAQECLRRGAYQIDEVSGRHPWLTAAAAPLLPETFSAMMQWGRRVRACEALERSHAQSKFFQVPIGLESEKRIVPGNRS